ncbi:MAG: glycosyltransferase family 39 protein [Pirellulales bacterium]|nr:glycosyltransferase family 39 protein [Pirellulales bacterium]
MRPQFDSLPVSEKSHSNRITQPREWFALLALLVFVTVIFAARLGLTPLVGEETRWGTAAREMLATGDWIVPRQQGQIFPERPPLNIWLMAAAGWLRGDVDSVAVRLPSVVAVVMTCLLVYVYGRVLLSPSVGLVAGLIYATCGQVLQIGRQGESEAAFALLVGASLLLWHLGYLRGWRPMIVWCVAGGFAAMAALTKGPQAPVYFGAIVGAYLAIQRDWRYLLSWQTLAGALTFVAIVAAWQVPFLLATEWNSVVATWTGLAADRLQLSGVVSHAATYPLETLVCLLPWSPMLLVLVRGEIRERMHHRQEVSRFLFTAILVAYPTVWLAAGARGRYFMPLYPLVAVLVGWLIELSATAQRNSTVRRMWNLYLLLTCAAMAAGALFVGGNALLPTDWAQELYQPRWFALLFAVVVAGVLGAMSRAYRLRGNVSPVRAATSIALVCALGFSGIMMNKNAARWNDPTVGVNRFREYLPQGVQLVSLTEIDHRFAYYYEEPIVELRWPTAAGSLPSSVDYFCFMRSREDTAEARTAGRGRTSYKTPGTLPFAWEELCSICTDRKVDSPFAKYVVLGRIIRPIRAEISDATVPQERSARVPMSENHR